LSVAGHCQDAGECPAEDDQALITKLVKPGSQLYTDEYNIYDRLESWGYVHKRVNHSNGSMPVMTTNGS